jgi:hypothetical protein
MKRSDGGALIRRARLGAVDAMRAFPPILLLVLFSGCLGHGLDVTYISITTVDVPDGAVPVERSGQVAMQEGLNALNQLNQFADVEGFEVTIVEDPAWGAYVAAIDGLAARAGPNGTDYWWSLRVNGVDAETGASDVLPKAGDWTEWRFVRTGP